MRVPDGKIAVAGTSKAPEIDLDPGDGTDIHNNHGHWPIFSSQKIDDSGNFLWGDTVGAVSSDQPSRLTSIHTEMFYAAAHLT